MVVSENDEVIGAVINNIMRRNDVNNGCDSENYKESSKFSYIKTFLYKAEREVDVFSQYPNVDHIMDMKIITVDKAYRGQGVCKALIGKSKYIKVENYSYVFGLFFSLGSRGVVLIIFSTYNKYMIVFIIVGFIHCDFFESYKRNSKNNMLKS